MNTIEKAGEQLRLPPVRKGSMSELSNRERDELRAKVERLGFLVEIPLDITP